MPSLSIRLSNSTPNEGLQVLDSVVNVQIPCPQVSELLESQQILTSEQQKPDVKPLFQVEKVVLSERQSDYPTSQRSREPKPPKKKKTGILT